MDDFQLECQIWKNWLDKRFGHADYLKLNKKWKQIHFENCAREITIAMNMERKRHENIRSKRRSK